MLFSKREDEKVESTDTQHPLLSLPVFVGKRSSFDSFYSSTQNNFSLLSILLSLKTHSRNSKRVFKGGLKRREFTKGLVLSFVLSLGTLYIVKKKEEDL